jgi:hypothetical protein
MARRFHLRQAEALLASVEGDLRQAMSLRDELAQVVSGLAGVARHVSQSGGALLHQSQVAEAKARQVALTVRLKEAIDDVHQYGCQIKDLEAGLIDFPTTFQGREVYLCWKVGENGIRFWHEVSDGFRGRKPIDQHFLENHGGDPAN